MATPSPHRPTEKTMIATGNEPSAGKRDLNGGGKSRKSTIARVAACCCLGLTVGCLILSVATVMGWTRWGTLAGFVVGIDAGAAYCYWEFEPIGASAAEFAETLGSASQHQVFWRPALSGSGMIVPLWLPTTLGAVCFYVLIRLHSTENRRIKLPPQHRHSSPRN